MEDSIIPGIKLQESEYNLEKKIEQFKKEKEEEDKKNQQQNNIKNEDEQQQQQQKQKLEQEQDNIEKQYQCKVEGCDKAYSRYPSLYTHIKLKHPDHPLQALIPQKNKNKDGEEVKPGSKPINIKTDIVNLLCDANFLMFFKEIKELPVFDDNLKEYFLPENSSYMKLDEELLSIGDQSLLKKLNGIIKELNQTSEIEDNSIVSVSGFLHNSVDSRQTIRSISQQSSSLQNYIPKYFVGVFIIAKELVKPLTRNFALEICYFFNKVIEQIVKLKGASIQVFKETISRELFKMLQEDKKNQKNSFKSLGQLSPEMQKGFCQKFAKNLSQLFNIKC